MSVSIVGNLLSRLATSFMGVSSATNRKQSGDGCTRLQNDTDNVCTEHLRLSSDMRGTPSANAATDSEVALEEIS